MMRWREAARMGLDAEAYRQSGSQLDSIMAVYSVENPQDITGVINDRIRAP